MASNTKLDTLLADVMPLDAEAFRTRRTGAGRAATVLAPDLLARIREIVVANQGMQSFKTFTSSKAEAEAYNDQRATAAKKAEKEIPTPLGIVENAIRLARKDAARFSAYVNEVAANLDTPKAVSLRVRNEGTEDHPQARWAFVLVNHRERAPKA
jgi:hypothetical protein